MGRGVAVEKRSQRPNLAGDPLWDVKGNHPLDGFFRGHSMSLIL